MVTKSERRTAFLARCGTASIVVVAVSACLSGLLACNDAQTGAPPLCTRSWKKIASDVDVDLLGVWARSPSEIWASGENGVILKCDEAACSVSAHGLANVLPRVRGIDDAVYAVGWATRDAGDGYETRIYRLDGDEWSRTDPQVLGQVADVWLSSEDRYAVGTASGAGRIWRETPTGWVALDNPFRVVDAAWGAASGEMYFVGSTKDAEGAVYRRTEDGFELTAEARSASYAGLFGVEGSVFVGGSTAEGSFLIGRLDESKIVEEKVSGAGTVRTLFGTADADLWAIASLGGGDGELLRRESDGWKAIRFEGNFAPLGGYSLDSSHTYIVGSHGSIYRYDCEPRPGSMTVPECEWQAENSVPGSLSGIWRSVAGRLFLSALTSVSVVEDGVISTLWSGRRVRLEAISGFGDTVFAVGVDGSSSVRKTLVVRCEGTTCEQMDLHFDGGLYDLAVFAKDSVIAVGMDNRGCSRIVRYDGVRWTTFDNLGCIALRGVWGSDSSDVWAGGFVASEGETGPDSGGLLHFDGNVWRAVETQIPVPLTAIVGRNATEVYAVGIDEGAPYSARQYGTIMRWDGASWSEILKERNRGYTSAAVDSEGALWAGALRWRDIEGSAHPEIVRFKDGEETVSRSCSDRSGQVVGLSVDDEGARWAIGSEGVLLRFQQNQ